MPDPDAHVKTFGELMVALGADKTQEPYPSLMDYMREMETAGRFDIGRK
jgi:hypothetical protein